ncbi:MAG: hypothetical protein AAFP97_03850 [Pseudomonadota bacterium]
MTYISAFLEDLTPEQAQQKAAIRLLSAIDTVAGPQSASDDVMSVDRDAVLSVLKEEEGKGISDDALRKRIGAVNRLGDASFELRDRKDIFMLIWDAKKFNTFRSMRVLKNTKEATRKNTAIDEDMFETPRVIAPGVDQIIPVFISHAWETEDIEDVVSEFYDTLKSKCDFLPEKYRHFQIELFFDRASMHGRADFEAQYLPKAQSAMVGVFLMSDKWFQSEDCQKEASCFYDSSDKPLDHKRFLRVRVSGNADHGDKKYSDYPQYPRLWDKSCKTLLDVWDKGRAARDAFTTKIRDEICEAIVELLPSIEETPVDKALEPKRQKTEHVYKAIQNSGRGELDAHVMKRNVIPLKAFERGKNDSVDAMEVLTDWARSDTAPNRLTALLGGFGAGKTTTAQMLANALFEDDNAPTPIYLDLRKLVSVLRRAENHPEIGELIIRALDSDVLSVEDVPDLKEIIRNRHCVIILDGLDEVGTRLGVAQTAKLYREFLDIIPREVWNADIKNGQADWAACKSRLFVTCRTQFFRDNIGEQSTLGGFDRHNVGKNSVRTWHVAPLSPDQIKNIFIRALGKTQGTEFSEQLEKVHDLKSLAEKPIMAVYLSEVCDEILARVYKKQAVNVAAIYKSLFGRTISRDGDKDTVLGQRDREQLLLELAIYLWRDRETSIAIDDLEDWLDKYIVATETLKSLISGTPDVRQRIFTEVRNASLLFRSSDNEFRFTHTSFFEFFLGLAFVDYIKTGQWADYVDEDDVPVFSAETKDFVFQNLILEKEREQKKFKKELEKLLIGNGSKAIRQFAVDLWLGAPMDLGWSLLPKNANLSDLNLMSCDWSGEDRGDKVVQNVNFERALLTQGAFTDLTFRNCQFDQALMGSMMIDHCRFEGCSGEPKYIESSRLFLCDTEGWGSGKTTGLKSCIDISSQSSIHAIRNRLSMASAIAYSPDGMRILSASNEKTLRIWDARSGVCVQTLEGYEGGVYSVTYSPDAMHILSVSDVRILRIWDADSGALVQTFEGHKGVIYGAAFSPDGAHVLSASGDHTIRMWDARGGACLKTLEGHEDDVNSVAYSPDGMHILSASDDNTIRIWDALSGTCLKTLQGHEDWVNGAVYSPDGMHIVSASDDATLRIWDALSGICLKTLEGHDGWVNSAVYSPDGMHIVSASKDKSLRIWDTRSGDCVKTLEGHYGWVKSVSYSPDGTYIVSASSDRTLRFWDAHSGDCVQACKGHERWVKRVAYSPDGTHILSASDHGNLRIWDAHSGACVQIIEENEDWINSVAYSPDGMHILSASDDNTIRIWDAFTGASLRTLKGHKSWVNSVAYSQDGIHVVSASNDRTLRIWDARSGDCLQTLKGHKGGVNSVAYSPDSMHILSASDDRTLRIWDTNSGDCVQTLEENDRWVKNASYSPDSLYILSVSDDETIRIWDPKTAQILESLKIDSAPKEYRSLLGCDRIYSEDYLTLPDGKVCYHFKDAWATFDKDGTLIGGEGPLWKYFHGVAVDEDGTRRAVSWDYIPGWQDVMGSATAS